MWAPYSVTLGHPVIFACFRFEGLGISHKLIFGVTPAEAGILLFQLFMNSSIRGNDTNRDFFVSIKPDMNANAVQQSQHEQVSSGTNTSTSYKTNRVDEL